VSTTEQRVISSENLVRLECLFRKTLTINPHRTGMDPILVDGVARVT
jgi:hypothetical protein